MIRRFCLLTLIFIVTFLSFLGLINILLRVVSNYFVNNEIRIRGDSECNIQTKQALDLLKEKSIQFYKISNKYIGIVECVEKGSGIRTWEIPARYLVGKPTREAGVIWYASTLVHEACHSRQYRESWPILHMLKTRVLGKNIEKECLNVQYDVLQSIGAEKYVLEHVKKSIDEEYWKVDYNKRWW